MGEQDESWVAEGTGPGVELTVSWRSQPPGREDELDWGRCGRVQPGCAACLGDLHSCSLCPWVLGSKVSTESR